MFEPSNMFGSDDMLRYISIALCVCGGIRYVGFSFLCITSNLFSNEEYFRTYTNMIKYCIMQLKIKRLQGGK